MIWNLLLQIGVGYFGKNIFLFNAMGLRRCFFLTAILQTISMFAFHHHIKNTVPENITRNKGIYFYKLVQLFIFKTLF